MTSGAYFICRMVTKWSRIFSDRVTEDVINTPSVGFFETRHDVRIRVDGQQNRRVSKSRLDDCGMHVHRQQRRGVCMAKAVERAVRQPGFAHDTLELLAQVIRVDGRTVLHSEDVVGVLSQWPCFKTHLNLIRLD